MLVDCSLKRLTAFPRLPARTTNFEIQGNPMLAEFPDPTAAGYLEGLTLVTRFFMSGAASAVVLQIIL